MPMEGLEALAPAAPLSNRDQRIDATRAVKACADLLDEEISSSQREIFDLYYGNRRGMKEIARDLGKSDQAIKISLFRTRRAMADRLETLDLREAG